MAVDFVPPSCCPALDVEDHAAGLLQHNSIAWQAHRITGGQFVHYMVGGSKPKGRQHAEAEALASTSKLSCVLILLWDGPQLCKPCPKANTRVPSRAPG